MYYFVYYHYSYHEQRPRITRSRRDKVIFGVCGGLAKRMNVDAVLIANPKTDLYNPNIIRSSVGCVFTNQIATGTTAEIIEFLQSKNISMYCAALLDSSENYAAQDYKNATAIIVGTEATGLSEEWLKNSTKNIIIPMQGAIDSMNVSVSAGILIYEAKRQRNFQ